MREVAVLLRVLPGLFVEFLCYLYIYLTPYFMINREVILPLLVICARFCGQFDLHLPVRRLPNYIKNR